MKVRVSVTCAGRHAAGPILGKFERARGLSVTLVRGRLTEDSAALELEIAGDPRRIEKLVRREAVMTA
jgi:hypothetical protein